MRVVLAALITASFFRVFQFWYAQKVRYITFESFDVRKFDIPTRLCPPPYKIPVRLILMLKRICIRILNTNAKTFRLFPNLIILDKVDICVCGK